MAHQPEREVARTPFSHFRLLTATFALWQVIATTVAAIPQNPKVVVSGAAVAGHRFTTLHDFGAGLSAETNAKNPIVRNMIVAPAKRLAFANGKGLSTLAFRGEKSTMGKRARSFRSSRRDDGNAAFAFGNDSHPSTNLRKSTASASNRFHHRSHHCGRAFSLRSRPSHSPAAPSVAKSSSSQSDGSGSYYYAASTLAPPPDGTYPNWWPPADSSGDDPLRRHISFADHLAHVIVPDVAPTEGRGNATTDETNDGGDAAPTLEDVVRWVLHARDGRIRDARPSIDGDDPNASDASLAEGGDDPEGDARGRRVEAEWIEGESVSDPAKVLDPAHRHDPSLLPRSGGPTPIAAELLALGSVWHLPLPSSKSATADRFDPSSGVKPTRLNAGDRCRAALPGDYLRVHFDPRRYTDANSYDWGAAVGAADGEGGRPGVVVARDDEAGYVVIDKPANVPVHARVDNSLENVAACVGRALRAERRRAEGGGGTAGADATESNDADAGGRDGRKKQRKQKAEPLVYVATPQRLDQNTSGLLVVATRKPFAAYFAKLLRTKTSGQLKSGGAGGGPPSSSSSSTSSCGVHKSYRCLVCVTPRNEDPEGIATRSMASEVDRLRGRVDAITRHYLEPSVRSPKRFERAVPASDGDDAGPWAECLLRITGVGEACTVVGNAPSRGLSRALWGDHGRPDGCIAVAECEVKLLTGRTHQIRGQLAAEGFPLVGDVQYGGAVAGTSSLGRERLEGREDRAESFLDSERLALQCCSLDFLDPRRGGAPSDGSATEKLRRSERWNSFRLDRAFWTPFVERYHEESAEIDSSEATSSLAAEEPLIKQSNLQPREDALTTYKPPPRVLLTPGSHKYVVVRAASPEGGSDDGDDEQWFVRSASPGKCGGPYHANVAEAVLRRLRSSGRTAAVAGGGRIDFARDGGVWRARVFGFSYGFGKGDHEEVAAIIERHTDIVATFDNSDDLY